MTAWKQLGHLISEIYETAINPNHWKKSLCLCGQYVGASHGVFITVNKNPDSSIISIPQETWFCSHDENSHTNKTIYSDKLLNMFADTTINQWQFGHHDTDHNFIDHDTSHTMGCWIDSNETTASLLALFRAAHLQPFNHDDLLLGLHFSSHLHRSSQLQRQTQALPSISDMAINALTLPVLVIDDTMIVQYLNVSAECLLNSPAHGLALSEQGKLFCTDSSKNDELIALIANANKAGAMFLNCKKIKKIFVKRLPTTRMYSPDYNMPLTLVIPIKSETTLTQLQLLSKLYRLTPAELRLSLALLQGKSLADHAKAEQASIETIRSHLKILFRKTGCCRQSELVALLSRVPIFNEHEELCELEQ